jgi:hypothetical protein
VTVGFVVPDTMVSQLEAAKTHKDTDNFLVTVGDEPG